MAAMFIHNFDALVTKDYLDSRFAEFEARITGEMDRRFHEVDQHFLEMNSRVVERFGRVDVRFARANILLSVILAAVVVPLIQTFVNWMV